MSLEKVVRPFLAKPVQTFGVEFFTPPGELATSFLRWGKGGRFGTLDQNSGNKGGLEVETPDKVPETQIITVYVTHGMVGLTIGEIKPERVDGFDVRDTYEHGTFMDFSIPPLRDEEKSRETLHADAEDSIPNSHDQRGIEGMAFSLTFDTNTFIFGPPPETGPGNV